MVRTLKLSRGASGSYYNLSQGVFDTIRYEQQAQPALEITSLPEISQNEPLIYPNPSTGRFNISFGSAMVNLATLQIYNMQGKLMREEKYRNPTLESFDISTLPKGIYMVKSIIDNKKMVTKIDLQ
jgi:hypothetical protein